MNDFKSRLSAIRQNQRNLLQETQALLEEYESSDLIHENEKLRRQSEEDRRELAALRAESFKLNKQNAELRLSLTEQILDEKLNILRLSRSKMDTYFAGSKVQRINRLRLFEEQARTRIHKMMTASLRLNGGEQQQFRLKLEELSEQLEISLDRQRRWQEEADRQAGESLDDGYRLLEDEGVDEDTIRRRVRQNRIEMKIGLNWINKLAILLILVAVGMAFNYTYSTWFNDYVRGSVFFLFGALLLGGGEWLYRRGRRTFALGLLGGGTAVLYGSIFYSYFLLGIIGMGAALLLSVLVTLTTVLLALRYESRTICALGLVGGYLPLLSYGLASGLSGPAVYAAMVYLLLLNLLLLLVSLHKRWTVVAYIGFALNTPAMLVLVWLADSRWIGAGYAFATFLMYLSLTLAYPMRFKRKLSEWDVALLGINTFVGCGVMYALLQSSGAIEFRGLLALLFGLLYAGLGLLAERLVPEEKNTRLLFYVTALVFAILIVPFQLGEAWTSLGWLAEACVLSVYGRRAGSKRLERGGWAVMLLCIAAFVVVDLPLGGLTLLISGENSSVFMVKYTLLTLGTLGLALFYAWDEFRNHGVDRSSEAERRVRYSPDERRMLLFFRYAALLNVWFYGVYETFYVYERLLPNGGSHYLFYKMLLAAAVTALLSFGLSRFTLIRDEVTRMYALIQYGIACFIGIALMLTMPVLSARSDLNGANDYAALAVLLVVNAAVFWSGNRSLRSVVRRYPQAGEWYPVGIAAYVLVMLTALLGVQLHVDDFGLLYSLAYLLVALGCILYGFRRRYVHIRRLGLILTLLCTAKLLIFDLGLNGLGSRILAYFAAGFILLGISYLYQRVSNRLEADEGKEPNDDAEKED